jgi:hypothetical protein
MIGTTWKSFRDVLDMGKQQQGEMMGAISRWLLASVLFLIIMIGWLGDSLLSALIRRPRLSFQEVYRSWKNHLLHP